MKLTINTEACKNTKDEVNYLEHVQAFITLKSSRRGDTVMFLTSPLGTRSAEFPLVIILKRENFSGI